MISEPPVGLVLLEFNEVMDVAVLCGERESFSKRKARHLLGTACVPDPRYGNVDKCTLLTVSQRGLARFKSLICQD